MIDPPCGGVGRFVFGRVSRSFCFGRVSALCLLRQTPPLPPRKAALRSSSLPRAARHAATAAAIARHDRRRRARRGRARRAVSPLSFSLVLNFFVIFFGGG